MLQQGIHHSCPPGRPGSLHSQHLHSCMADLEKDKVIFPVTHSRSFLFFFFRFKGTSSALHPAEAKCLLIAPPKHRAREQPPPSSQKLTAEGTLQTEKGSCRTPTLFLPTFTLSISLAKAGPPLLHNLPHCWESPAPGACAKNRQVAEKAPEPISTAFQVSDFIFYLLSWMLQGKANTDC